MTVSDLVVSRSQRRGERKRDRVDRFLLDWDTYFPHKSRHAFSTLFGACAFVCMWTSVEQARESKHETTNKTAVTAKLSELDKLTCTYRTQSVFGWAWHRCKYPIPSWVSKGIGNYEQIVYDPNEPPVDVVLTSPCMPHIDEFKQFIAIAKISPDKHMTVPFLKVCYSSDYDS